MTEYAFDGNAARQAAPAEAPPRKEHRRVWERKKESAHVQSRTAREADPTPAPKGRWAWSLAPKAVGVILVVTAVVVMILASYAQLVMVNDQLVDLRSDLRQLEKEETKLMAQYELSYDLQEIEKQMLATGQMNKIQSWQTYTLELSEPDSVEYYQGWDFKGQAAEFARNFAAAVQEYF